MNINGYSELVKNNISKLYSNTEDVKKAYAVDFIKSNYGKDADIYDYNHIQTLKEDIKKSVEGKENEEDLVKSLEDELGKLQEVEYDGVKLYVRVEDK